MLRRGRPHRFSADAEVVLLVGRGGAARRAEGVQRLRFGDTALFYALLDALALPERWRLKLRHHFWRPPAFHALLVAARQGRDRPNGEGPAAALAATPRPVRTTARAEELVGAYLGDGTVCRCPATARLSEITARLLDHAADLRAEPLPREVATVIDYYLAVAASPQARRSSASP